MNQNNYKPPCTEARLRQLYEVDIHSQKEIANLLGCSLKAIQTAMRHFGVQPRKQIKRNQWGQNNATWKGRSAKYQALHLRVAVLRGKPRICEICGTTTAKHYDWASVSGRYDDPTDYKRLCRSCHWKMDKIIRNLSAKH